MQEVQVGQVYSPNKSTELQGVITILEQVGEFVRNFRDSGFSEHVSPLFLSVHFDNCDGAVAKVRPKVMPFDLKILRTIGNLLVSRQEKCIVVGAP
jgi:hypothetical protein